MKSHSLHVRTKVTALLVSLVALWTFAAVVTVREGLSLVWLGMLDVQVGQPIESVVDVLQQERLASVAYLSSGRGAATRTGLTNQRSRTDEAVAKFRKLARSDRVRLAGTAVLGQRIDGIITNLDALGDLRQKIDAGTISTADAADAYTSDVSAAFLVYRALSTLNDETVAKEGRALITLSQAREVLAQEDALLAGLVGNSRLTADELQRFNQLVGAQRYLRTEAATDLPADDAAVYQSFLNSPAYLQFTVLEDEVLRARANQTLTFTSAAWQTAAQAVLSQLRQVVLTSASNAIKHAQGPAAWVLVRLVLAAGLGLIAVIASIVVSITTARALVRQLERLRTAAEYLAIQRLPGVVERLSRGEAINVAAEVPPLEFGTDEIGQVGRAFNVVQETAVRAAVEQAELRRGVREVFLGLARRTQALVHRQLGLLDRMERRETDPEELADLFRVDHLATRMRRNAENLIVLAGAIPGRGWRKPVPVVDVLRGALAEVEEYTRVSLLPVESALVTGRAVGDLIHLVAELIENALSFSPPYTRVQVGGVVVANGFAVEIEDRGLGMSDADLESANDQLVHPPEFNLSNTARLGLFVVGRLAARHGIRVRLRESPYGGTTAIVLIPAALLVDPADAAISRANAATVAELTATAFTTTALAADPPAAQQPTGDPRAQQPTGDHPAAQEPAAGPPARQPTTAASVTQPVPAPENPPAPPAGPTDPATNGKTDPEASDGPPEPPRTPSGLPWRVRQASLTQPAQLGRPALGTDGATGPAVPINRSPEEVRKMMASFQFGTRRGRTESGQDPGSGQPDEATITDGEQS